MINPRDYLKAVYKVSDEAIEGWQKHHLCLCGCGEQTSLMAKKRASCAAPKGEYSFFIKFHNFRIMDNSLIVKHQDNEKKLERFVETISERTMEPKWVGYLVREYIDKHPNETMLSIARRAKLSTTHFYEICSGSHPRIYKSTYLRILDAIGEPYHPDWEKYRSMHVYKGGKNFREVAA